MTIGARIKARREELGLSQEELAVLLNYKSRSSINKIELGGNELTQKKIQAIADALSVTPSYIMGWAKENEVSVSSTLSTDEKNILSLYRELNEEGQERLVNYLEDLHFSGRYKKHDEHELDSKKQA